MLSTAEAVIIGGGIIGNSIAYFLTRLGMKPVVAEAGDLATGASGACDKAIILSSKHPGIHLELAAASAGIYRALAQEMGEQIEYSQDGGMVVIETEPEWEAMQQFVERQRRSGLDIKLLDRQETLRLQPALAPDIIGAAYHAEDAEVNPINMTMAFAGGARAQGARYLLGTRVTAILTDRRGRVKGVDTERGRIDTLLVINAAGAWAPQVARMVGVELPIRPRRGQLLITEPMPRLIRGDILSARYIAAKYKPELAAGSDLYSRLGVGLSLGQTKSGNFIIGATREFAGYDTNTTPEGIRAVAENAVRIVPALAAVNLIRTFAGLRPYTPDGLPILGWTPGVEGLFTAAGHEGDGIALAPVTGKLVAQAAAGQETDFSLEPFSLSRFGA